MSAKTRAKIYERMSQERLDSLIVKKEEEPIFIEREHVEPKPILYSEEEFDTLHPEEAFKNFCSSVRDMIGRYEADKERLVKLESEMQDLLHFMEMGKNKNARDGFLLYQKLSEVRRERRICKNEIDLLQPVYNAIHGTTILDMLAKVQGECRVAKQTITNKGYTVRTDILDDFVKGRD